MAQFTVNIPDAELTEFARDFLVAKPIPLEADGVTPQFTTQQWIRRCVVQFLNKVRNHGIDIAFDRTLDTQYNSDRNNRPPRNNVVS